ncbi:hypothetical protein VHUM_01635 [Vanrija humicola]|uniref:Major facilitator superfamily (MFS) profile domain-containing protein n=1 Tax=Vanrija humicola TaxID=5417 RepID=A0A7D8ZQS0_VANHU|nr:hypothetical protein VHUM_01635 [Vanrija humicola]
MDEKGDAVRALALHPAADDADADAWVRSLDEHELERESRRLKRKVDFRLMPCLFVLLVFNYLDRNALSLARVQGIEADLGLKGNNFNTAISVLFCGYILGQLPSNLVLSRVRPSVYLSVMCVLWGIVSAATAAADNFAHLVVVRFFLGVLESPFFPGALFLLSSWYTKKELAFRTSILYCGSYLSGAFAGLIAAGVQRGLKGKRGLTSWQWLFILEGSLTVLVGLVAVFILPDYPATTRWLTPREKALAAYRLERDTGILDKETMPLRQAVKAAAKDYKLWMFALIYATMATAGGYSPFVPTVVNTFGLSQIKTLLLSAPPFLVPVFTQPLVSFFSDRKPERCLHYTTPMWFAIVGFILAATTTTTAPRYLSIFYLTGGLSSSFSVLLAWVGSTFARPRTKRAAAYGIINALGNMAQIWSPYMYPKGDGPRYKRAFSVSAVMVAIAIALSFILRECMRRENARMDAEDDGEGDEEKYRLVL